jgi:hypothetical protein
MRRRTALALLCLAAASGVLAQEGIADFGTVEGRACSTTVWERSGAIGTPVPQTTYSRRLVTIQGHVLAGSGSERENKVLRQCTQEARAAILPTVQETYNTFLLRNFGAQVKACIQRAGRIPVYDVYLSIDENCEPAR